MYFKRCSKVSGKQQLLRFRNQIVNKITQKLDYRAAVVKPESD